MTLTTRRTLAVVTALSAAFTVSAAPIASAGAAPQAAKSAAKQGKKKPKISKRQKAKVRAFRKSVAYNGPVGTVVHFKVRNANQGGQDGPFTTEAWVEIGGGERYRFIDRYRDRPAGDFTQTTWGSPKFWVTLDPGLGAGGTDLAHVESLSGDGKSITSVVHIARSLPAALTTAAGAPAGEPVNGRATKLLSLPSPFATPTTDPAVAATFERPQVLVDAATLQPLRSTWMNERLAFRSWEQLAQGTGADALAQTIPLNAEIDG